MSLTDTDQNYNEIYIIWIVFIKGKNKIPPNLDLSNNQGGFFLPAEVFFHVALNPRNCRLLQDNKMLAEQNSALPRRPAQGLKRSIGFVLTPDCLCK